MNKNLLLTLTSVLSVALLSTHISDDIAHGFDRGGLNQLIGMVFLAFYLYGILAMPRRRTALIIILLCAVSALGMPVIHMKGSQVDRLVKAGGNLFFIWNLYALGVLGMFSLALVLPRVLKPGEDASAKRVSSASQA